MTMEKKGYPLPRGTRSRGEYGGTEGIRTFKSPGKNRDGEARGGLGRSQELWERNEQRKTRERS